LSVDALARELEVSQTPIRQALAKLEADGLVVRNHLRGFRAMPLLSSDEFNDLFDMRSLLEPFAAGRASLLRSEEQMEALEKLELEMAGVPQTGTDQAHDQFAILDSQFHDMVLAASGNALIRECLSRAHSHMHIFRSRRDPVVVEGGVDEHRAIVEAIRRQDPYVAEAAMRSHIELARKRILRDVEEGSEDEPGVDQGHESG